MNTSQLLSHHDQICEAARNLMVKKNADYAEAEAPFKNFELSERLGLCSTEAGMAIRLSDKIQRLCGFLAGKDLKVKDESVQDTILDAVNYLVLISARLKQRKETMKEVVLRDPLGAEDDVTVWFLTIEDVLE